MKTSCLKTITIILALLFFASFALSDQVHDFTEAKAIIDQKTPCSSLTQDQLEMLGDYYMEQIHPGEAHEAMDAMMGGEGSQSLRQVHIAIGYRFYCSGLSQEANQYYGMMGNGYNYGMMGGIMGSGMMGTTFAGTTSFPQGMMQQTGNTGFGEFTLLFGQANTVLFTIALLGFIVLVGIKISKEFKGGKK